MLLQPGGMDICYIDESMDNDVFAMVCITVPFLRQVEGVWTIIWPSHFEGVKNWRRYLRNTHGIPMNKELHGQKFASGRGRYRMGKQQFGRPAAAAVFRDMLSRLDFLPDSSIISVVGTKDSNLYGMTKFEATLLALFQRMRTATSRANRNGLVFFDEGHGEYRKLYRKSLIYLPTGSMYGGWGDGRAVRNMPMDNFTKDGNIKQSRVDYFIQVADMVSYALHLKIKGEIGTLTDWQREGDLGTLYNSIPVAKLNRRASRFDPARLGIVRL